MKRDAQSFAQAVVYFTGHALGAILGRASLDDPNYAAIGEAAARMGLATVEALEAVLREAADADVGAVDDEEDPP